MAECYYVVVEQSNPVVGWLVVAPVESLEQEWVGDVVAGPFDTEQEALRELDRLLAEEASWVG